MVKQEVTYLAGIGVLGGGDLAVAGELHPGEMHHHGGDLEREGGEGALHSGWSLGV